MRSTHNIATISAALTAVLLLGACSNEAATGTTEPSNSPATGTTSEATSGTTTDSAASTNATDETSNPVATESSTTEGASGTNSSAESSAANTSNAAEPSASSTRPATETFELMEKGTLVKRTAKLQHGDGYSMYVFDGYTLDANKNQLRLTATPAYHVNIKKLDSKAVIDDLRKQGKAQLKQYGEVREYSGDQLYESPMAPALLCLQTSDEKGTHEFWVWQAKDGSQYTFTVHSPEGETAGSFGLLADTSMSTIAADSAS
ncbi:hypothetical protein [Paenibacillus campi]|uniref:hypothetical protein n=1 Tax=Paenibacillus campi TaxID=3106031 RepID=UPI002B00178D|nr:MULTISPECIES: hypothetical protein [unclassified Paenibacillus]